MRAPDFWRRGDLFSRIAVGLFTPLGWAYGATVRYRARHAQAYRFSGRVICVGNLTAGGTGKTPIAMAIAHKMISRGYKTALLTRGYGGKVRGPAFVMAEDRSQHVGDEPLLLARVAPVIVARDRAAGAKLAEENAFDVIVMDDGHQNFSLQKDLSFVVIDSEEGVGNGRVIPAGPLREPVAQGLSRADCAILVGDGTAPALAGFKGPMISAKLEASGEHVLRGAAIIAFAGIGRPAKFFDTITQSGGLLVEALSYSDHHSYTQAEIARLKAKARSEKALLITTEKDYVRLTPAQRDGIISLPIIASFREESTLDRLLDGAMRRAEPLQPI